MPKQAKIKDIRGREILDSRGNPTVAVTVILDNGVSGTAAVPSGASTGTREAIELRDKDPKRYGGQGVLKAVSNVNGPIRRRLIGLDPTKQRQIDELMIKLDGTKNKAKLGANAILGVSLAVARAAAAANKQPLYVYLREAFGLERGDWRLPIPMMNILNGGAHADFAIDFQECMIMPQQRKFAERVRCGSEIFHALKKILKKKGHVVSVGDEGGYAPHLSSNRKAFELIMEAIKAAGYVAGKDVFLGTDVAASEFYDAKKKVYVLRADKKSLTSSQMIALYGEWLKKFPIALIEDGLSELDWDNWEPLTAKLGKRVALVGDDIFVTNPEILAEGIRRGIGNAILIKLNQIGSLSETVDAVLLAQKNRYKIAVSHRSGETADAFIADFAVAVGAEFIKTGSLSRSERLEKYNRLMEIEIETAGKK